MLALDLVQAGAPAHAVRDAAAAVQQIAELHGQATHAVVVVAAFRELSQAVGLWESLQSVPPAPAFVAVVLRSQRDTAAKYIDSNGWAGVAVRPVTAEDLVDLVSAAAERPSSVSRELRTGDLQNENLLDLLGGLIDRIPRPGAGRTATIHLSSGDRQGMVALVEGVLVHAEVDDAAGRHALERIATWKHGSFALDATAWGGQPSLAGSSLALLAVAQEYARRVDEARLNLPYLDSVCTVRWERVRPLPVVAEALFRRIATGLTLGDAIAGEGDDELEAFAALEARIKRGAVVPLVEPASKVAAAPEVAPPTSLLAGMRRPGASGGFETAQTAMIQGAQLPERKHSHPSTNLYRVTDPVPPTAAESAVPDLPGPAAAPGSAVRTTAPHGTTAAPVPADPTAAFATPNYKPVTPQYTPAPQGDRIPDSLPGRRHASGDFSQDATTVRGIQPETVLRSRPASSLLATASARKPGPVTGWFGVASGEANEAEVPPTMDGRRAHSSVRVVDRNMDGDRLVAGPAAGARISSAQPGPGDLRGSERPYAWIPTAQLDEETPEPPAPKQNPLLKPKNWPWVVAAVLALSVVVWLVIPHSSSQSTSPQLQRYHAAIELIDNGHSDRARTQLRELAGEPQAPAETLLHLAVLDIEAKDFVASQRELSSYLTRSDAQHRDRARRLYHHVFGAPPTAAGPAAGL